MIYERALQFYTCNVEEEVRNTIKTKEIIISNRSQMANVQNEPRI